MQFDQEGWKGVEVKIADLPAPYNKMIPIDMGPDSLTYMFIYEPKQDVIVSIDVKEDGRGNIEMRLSNGKALDGDHYTMSIVFLGEDGKELDRITVVGGIDATLGGGTKIAYVNTPFDREPDWWRSVKSMVWFFGKWDAKKYEKDLLVAAAEVAIATWMLANAKTIVVSGG